MTLRLIKTSVALSASNAVVLLPTECLIFIREAPSIHSRSYLTLHSFSTLNLNQTNPPRVTVKFNPKILPEYEGGINVNKSGCTGITSHFWPLAPCFLWPLCRHWSKSPSPHNLGPGDQWLLAVIGFENIASEPLDVSWSYFLAQIYNSLIDNP